MSESDIGSKKSSASINEERFLRAARAYALKRFPNPDRKGCLTAQELGAMARHKMPLSPAISGRVEHIATCSPCLSQFLAAREKWKRQRYMTAILAVAAALVIVIASVTWVSSPLPPPPPGAPPVVELDRPDARPQLATLDLRPFDVSRGNPNRSASLPVLPRANLQLTVLLPVGSEAGSYVLEVRDEKSATIIQGAGVAVIRNYVTRIETTIDLRSLNPGQFTWAVRRAGESGWRSYRLKVN